MADYTLFQELRLNLSMAQSAVTKFESAQGRFQGLMLTRLASVVLLSQNRLSTGDAGAKMTATFTTVDIELSDQGLAAGFRTFELLLLLISRRMSTEKLEGQVFVLLSLLGSQ